FSLNSGILAGPNDVDLANFNLGHLAGLRLSSPVTDEPIVNYRLYGDQVSLVPGQFGATKSVDDVSNWLVDASVLLGPLGWLDQHKLENLLPQLDILCSDHQSLPDLPCANVRDGATGPNIIGLIAKPVGTAFTIGYVAGNLGIEVGSTLWPGWT